MTTSYMSTLPAMVATRACRSTITARASRSRCWQRSTKRASRMRRSDGHIPKLANPGEFFHRWITRGEVPGHEDGSPSMSFFHFERSWWEARRRSNVLMVHYNDLQADLSSEMERISAFLGISVVPNLWPALVEAASFEVMRRDGEALIPN